MEGIPCMGSKRRLAKAIIDYIILHNPNAKYFYDLFGGGCAISLEALKRKQFKEVYYNELNTGVVNLLKHLIKNGITDDMYNWVSRSEFEKSKNKDDYWGGLVKTCWSFGNNQKNYLFGKDVELIKKLGHKIAVDNSNISREKLNFLLKTDIPKEIHSLKTMNERRLYLSKFGRNNELQQLERLERLGIQNKSFDEVRIKTPIDETIIYLDPPYKGTASYSENEDGLHVKIDEYIRKSPCKIYISSYEWVGLHEVKKFSHRSTLSATANNKVVEKLFCNQEENIKTTLF